MSETKQSESEQETTATSRQINLITAGGWLIVLITLTALVTYGLLTIPGKLSAQQGPPEAFLAAATQQAASETGLTSETNSVDDDDSLADDPAQGTSGDESSANSIVAAPAGSDIKANASPVPTENPFGEWALPDWVEERFWLSIPGLNLEAPIIALSTRAREIEGVSVDRLLVPNSYAVSWDERSAQPGFNGNTILTGHSNLYGGVFSELDQLTYGSEIAVWSERGVFSYYVTVIEYVEENDQPLEVRLKNAQWLNDTPNDQITLITCWPNSNSSYRLIIVATP